MGRLGIVVGALLGVAAVVWLLLVRYEGEAPAVALDSGTLIVGAKRSVDLALSDAKSGLRQLRVSVVKNGREAMLLEREFASGGFWQGGRVRRTALKVDIEPARYGLSDGRGVLRTTVSDFSWRNWGRGNQTVRETELLIDTAAPRLEVVSRAHNVNQGGSGLVVYRVSEPCERHGVLVGDNFFPGHGGNFADPQLMLAFFALGYDQGPGTDIVLTAIDPAGNAAQSAIAHHINPRKFKADTLNISDSFLQRKMPEFQGLAGLAPEAALIDKFLKINGDLRQRNFAQVVRIGAGSDSRLYWEGAFQRMPGAARRAGFADHRQYRYKGRIVDRQVHMGIDLASVARDAVPAANRGKVVFAGRLGIYGQAVMIDHGCGLMSMYAHLSSLAVTTDQIVAAGQILGRTGATGLAGGDHLHFAMLIHNTFITPVEWWDANWIRNNIGTKLDDARAMSE